jgi:hypothetical protein
VSVEWLTEVLGWHDPLSAWPPTAASAHDYQPEAELVVHSLRHLQGMGHARMLVADALDQLHPGLYRAIQDNVELSQRLGRIAAEIWDFGGRARGPDWSVAEGSAPQAVPTQPPLERELVSDEDGFTAWLRGIEAGLEAEHAGQSDLRPAREALGAALPAVLEAYASGTDQQRAAVRRAVSRFRLVLYEVSMFGARQWNESRSPNSTNALRQALLAVSVIDGGLDWRDELLMLRHLRQVAMAANLPFEDFLHQAAACSSERTAGFLLSVL